MSTVVPANSQSPTAAIPIDPTSNLAYIIDGAEATGLTFGVPNFQSPQACILVDPNGIPYKAG